MRLGLAGPCNPQALCPLLWPEDAARAPHSDPGVPVEHLARALIDRGHHVIVYTLAPVCPQPMTLTGPGLTLHIGAYRPRHRMRDLFAQERHRLITALRADPPDLLNAHWGYEYALAAQEAAVAPVLISQHDWAPSILFWQPTAYRLGRLVMYLRALRRGNPLTAPSPVLADHLRRWLRQDCTVIPNGIAPEAIAPEARRFPDGPPRLLAVNQGFSRLKNVRALLRAFPLIRATFPGVRLRLLGHGHGPGEAAERWAAARHLTTGVDFIGQAPADQVRQELSDAHTLIHPSRTESFGLVLVEAMAQGTPVIANAAAAGPRWVLQEGACGILCPTGNPHRLAATCIGLLSDPRRWEHLSRTGLETVRQHYAMPEIAAAYERLYRALLSNGTPDIPQGQPQIQR